jgi:hypothetical protein
VYVAAIVTGLITGAASENPIAAGSGSPFDTDPRATGNVPHSQSGAAAPSATPEIRPNALFRGKKREMRSGATATSSRMETSTPKSSKQSIY